ncbi:unnamed protein product [Phyllotreta striolata]|uniref:Peptidase S1 domain-containing protein n=1 Tax=Phyllotreta striolata TaxID=444603 RepID=A0A9N9XP00_PHYSR|nr:unnamed protein product [Phyllotreta striolata]
MGERIALLLLLLLFVLQVLGSMSLIKQDCGRSVRRSRQPRAGMLGRIIQGKQSKRGAWPWQVSLQLLHPQFGFLGHWCGGVMISSEWLLTAAHCISNDLFNLPLAALWTAVIGEWDREVEEYSEQRIPIEEVILHERFHNFQHDIALMKLSRPVKFTRDSRIRAVCLPTSRLLHNQTDLCYATGWGRATEDGMLSVRLLESRVPVHDNAVCRKKYGHAVPIKSGHLCAGHLDGSSGTCVGDSGGPLQCAMQDGRWILAGITSFGSGCAKPGFPDVYTRLSYYLPWIKSKTRSPRRTGRANEGFEDDQ